MILRPPRSTRMTHSSPTRRSSDLTWEGQRSNVALAKLIDGYRAHILAVLGNDIGALHETRTAARAARTRVLASLDRMRAEPGRERAAELAASEAFLAN